jgi:hypothetical protein
LGAQTQVIAESEQALANYAAALKELDETDQTLRTLHNSQLQMLQRAVSVGEEDQLALNGVQLQSSVIPKSGVKMHGGFDFSAYFMRFL